MRQRLGTLIFDGECRFCLQWVDRLRRWDRWQRITFLPLQHPAASLLGVPRTALEEAMHFVRADGAVFGGARAAPEILRAVPWGWLVRWVFAVPGVSPVASGMYRWIARRRHRFGCASDACHR